MIKNTRIVYNPYFLFPFLAWVVAGGVLLMVYDWQTLFYAINTHNSDALDWLFCRITFMGQPEVIVPVLLSLLFIPRFRNWQYFFLALCCNVIPLLVQQALKSIFDLPRPLYYFQGTAWLHFSADWPALFSRSFPSGHSEGAFSFFCFLSLLLPTKSRAFALLFFVLALSVCYSRIYLAAHFFEDVYAGSIIGAVLTTLIFSVMGKKFEAGNKL